jgi:hypothetical protein
MPFLLAALCGLAFGALDQYLGSLISLGLWASSVSGLSAPWLVLPFVAGWTQRRPRRAMAVGLVAVCAALLGYFAMTASPLESVPPGEFGHALLAVARANRLWIAGGLVTAPLYGLLGQRWRTTHAWASAALLAGCVCLEPSVRWMVGNVPRAEGVWLAEIGVGACLACYFLAVGRRRRAPRRA